jgi:predicted metalloprotease with PDZ domain
MAGKYFRRLDLDPDAGTAHRAPVFVDVVADAPSQLEVTPEQLAAHLALVTQATRLFASRHFAHYDFLLAISDRIGGIGREHHQSTEIAVRSGYFVDWGQAAFARDVLPHEFTHSWNGKFRRPFDLATPNTNTPMQDSLLWMYEGQTQYWGVVLSARSGLMSNDDVRDTLADIAATAESRSGRVWRNLQDTTNTPLFTDNYAEGHDWSDWQRGADYYDEMALVWLEADMVIRSASKGQRSLDDFARAFLGPMAGRSDRDFAVTTYRFEDVVAALDGVQHYDWTRFLRERLDTHAANWRATGLELAGWRLTWSDKPNARTAARAKRYEYDDFVYSIGVGIDRDGQLSSVRWNSPAFEARLTTSARVIAVNGEAYKPALLSQAIRDAHDKGSPIELLIRDGDHYKTVPIDWKGGLRYPKLERIDGRDDGLAMVLAPKS